MRRFTIILALIAFALTGAATAAQDATPETGGCTVTPRRNDEISALAVRAATPSGEPSIATVRLPAGEPVDTATADLLLVTLNETEACAEARDLQRFLALYTDTFIVESILAPEPAGVIIGGPPAGQEISAGTPTVPPTTVIDDAHLLEDGRIAAHVFRTGASDFGTIVWFELVDGRWLIDDIRQAADPPSGTTTIPEGAQAIVDAAIADAASTLGVEAGSISLASIKPVDWPDAALGCPEEGGVYAGVITPGYRIILTDGKTTLTYHTDAIGTVVNCTPD